MFEKLYHNEQGAGYVEDTTEQADMNAAVGTGETLVPVFNPQQCMDEQAIANAILKNINWDMAEPVEGTNGPYTTTRAHNITAKPGNGFRYQINVSVNRREDKGNNVNALTTKEKRAADALGLTAAEAERILTAKRAPGGKNTQAGAMSRIDSLRR